LNITCKISHKTTLQVKMAIKISQQLRFHNQEG
jgi:hypothetical protein